LVEERSIAPEETWMIGNSPKSDINPALEAGLGAVLVPHPHTWVLEHQEVRTPSGARFLQVEKFSDLSLHF
jgi:putative hydrolase of the HAD superfamily